MFPTQLFPTEIFPTQLFPRGVAASGVPILLEDGTDVLQEDGTDVLLEGSSTPSGGGYVLLEDGGSVLTESGGHVLLEGGTVLTLREAVRAWLVGQASVTAVVGQGVYFGVPSQLAAYPCIVVLIPTRSYGHNLAGADGTSVATVEISALGLKESDCIAGIEAIRNFADGFQGLQSGVAVMSCLLDDESDPMPVPPPDGSDQWIYQATIEYRVKHRVPKPTAVTNTPV